MRPSLLGQSVILAMLVASPAAGADRMIHFGDGGESSVSAGYLGATLSLFRSNEGSSRPGLRFGAGIRHQPLRAASVAIAPPTTVEFRVNSGKDHGLYFGGKRLALTKDGGGPDAGEVILIVAGVAAAALLVTQIASSDDDSDDDEGRCRIEPWLCQ